MGAGTEPAADFSAFFSSSAGSSESELESLVFVASVSESSVVLVLVVVVGQASVVSAVFWPSVGVGAMGPCP